MSHLKLALIATVGLLICLPLSARQGLSLDELMGGPSPAPAGPANSMAPAAPAPASSYDPSAASIDLGTIEAGRAIVQQRNAFQQLQQTDSRIRSQCSCAGSGNCYDLAGGLSYDQVREAAAEAEASLADTLRTVCESWPGPGDAGQTMAMIETRQEIARKIQQAIDQVGSSATDVRRQLAQKDNEIRRAIAAQEEAANPGFNWGQFTAMTVGVVAGGIGNLDVTQQADIMTSIAIDSMNGGGTMSNFQGTMDSLTSELASMQRQTQIDVPAGWEGYDFNAPVDNLMRETQMMNEAAEDIARTLMGEEVDISTRSYYAGEIGSVPSLDALMGSVGSPAGMPASTAASGFSQPGMPATSVAGGSANGFDPAMRPGGATAYDAVGNSSGIQGASTPGSNVASREDTVINETYQFTCPSGTQSGPIPIVADSQVCANAMKRFARVYSCNLFEEYESAQLEMNRVCASNMFE